MSCLWTCLSLLFLAHFLQKSASVTAVVSLKCNPTVEIVAREAATLNCNITTTVNCIHESYNWNNTRGKIPCDTGLMEYTCDWDNMTYVSLTIRNVMRDENYTILIRTDCGTAVSHIKLQVKQNSNITHGEFGSTPPTEQTTNLHVTMFILTIFIALFGILCFLLFRTNRGREITGCFKKREKEEENPMMEEDTTKCETCV